MKGVVDLEAGELNLDKTMRSGQTFCWHRLDGEEFYGADDRDEPTKYYSTVDGEIVILWQDGTDLHYETSGELNRNVGELFRLHEPMDAVIDHITVDDTMTEAVQNHRGLRVMQDDFVPTVLSYVCATQKNVSEVKETFDSLLHKFGNSVEYDGKTFKQFPSLYELSDVSERELRRMGLGYRAKYVKSAIRHLIKGKVNERALREMDYKESHEEIQTINGVGDHVADAVLLYSLGKTQAVPLDSWSWQAVAKHYPDHHSDDYHETADNLREYFGPFAGYAQQYLFHHLRNQHDAWN